MTITRATGNEWVSTSTQFTNPTTLAFPNAVQAGSLLAAVVWCIGNLPQTLSDSVNGAWTLGGEVYDDNTVYQVGWYYKANAAAGTTTVSALSSSADVRRLAICEYLGAATASPVDGTWTSTPGESSAPNPGSITTTGGGVVVGAMRGSGAPGVTPGTGFTEWYDGFAHGGAQAVALEDRITSAGGVYTPGWATSRDFWVAIGFALKEASGGGGITGALAATLGALAGTGSGTVDVSGSLSKPLGTLSASGAGAVAISGIGAATLDALAASGAGTVADAGVEGALSQTLGSLAAAGTGTVDVSGSLSKTLDAATVIGTGTVDVAGAGAVTLGALVSAGAGAVAVDGAASITLGDLALAGTGSVVSGIDGTLNKTLGELAAAGAGAVTIEGALAVTLGDLALDGAGESTIEGSLSKTLGQLVAAGVGNNGEVSAAADGGYLLAWRRWPRR